MKTFFALFFLCLNFNFEPVLKNQSNLEYVINDEVDQNDQQIFTFNLTEELANEQSMILKSKLKGARTKTEQIKLTESIILSHKPMNLELDEKLFNQLKVYNQLTTITYKLNFASLIKFNNTEFEKDYIKTNFQMLYDQNLNDHSKYIDNNHRVFNNTETSFPLKDKQIYIKYENLSLKKENQKNYLVFHINMGLDLVNLYSLFMNGKDDKFVWMIELILTSLIIEINQETYNFNLAKIFTTTYFYEEKNQSTLDLIEITYKKFLESNYFVWLEETFPKLKFNFEKFWQLYNFEKFNPLLVFNQLKFQLEITNILGEITTLEIGLNLIYQQHFQWIDDLNYEVKDLLTLMNLLQEKIVIQGFDLSLFYFKVEPTQIVITSQNSDLINFDPITINYQLLEKSVDLVNDSDLIPNQPKVDQDKQKSKTNFNSNYFYFLIIPISFLIIYLTLFLLKKSKKQKMKMIK